MRENLTFVTCIYDDLFETELGGRVHPFRKYFYGIESALKMQAPFVIFTWLKDIERVSDYYKKFLGEKDFNNRIKVVPYDLYKTNIRDSIKIERSKNPDNFSGDRCFDVMLGKFFMIKETIEKNYFNSEFFFWIDAGLSSSSLFPNKYLDLTDPEKQYSWCNLFTPKVVDNLIKLSKDKILLIKQNAIGHWFHPDHLPPDHGSWYIVGGMFGGRNKMLVELCDESIKSFLNLISEHSVLYTEEQVLTINCSFNKEKFNIIEFETWHHENSGDWAQEFIIDKKNFYKIFEELNV